MESLAPFFADFAVDATVGGEPVRGIFDNGFALGSVGIGMATTQPTITCRSADIAADPVGMPVVVAGASYLVAAHEPDGSGVSRLLLERA